MEKITDEMRFALVEKYSGEFSKAMQSIMNKFIEEESKEIDFFEKEAILISIFMPCLISGIGTLIAPLPDAATDHLLVVAHVALDDAVKEIKEIMAKSYEDRK